MILGRGIGQSKMLDFVASTILWMHLPAYVVGGTSTCSTFESLNISSFKDGSKKVVVSLPMTAPKFFLAMMRAACWLGVSSSALASSMADHPCCAMFTMCCRVSGSFTKPIRPSLPRTSKGSKRLSSPMRNFDRRLSTTFSHKKTLPPKFEKNSWHERSQPFTPSRYLAPCHICKQRWHIHR